MSQANRSLRRIALIVAVAERLAAAAGPQATIARIGGDEFVLLLESIERPANAERVVAKLRKALDRPLCLDGQRLCIVPSIGVAHYPEDGEQAETLLKHADAAMYREKRAGQAQSVVEHPEHRDLDHDRRDRRPYREASGRHELAPPAHHVIVFVHEGVPDPRPRGSG